MLTLTGPPRVRKLSTSPHQATAGDTTEKILKRELYARRPQRPHVLKRQCPVKWHAIRKEETPQKKKLGKEVS
jgi:hypothetical protein